MKKAFLNPAPYVFILIILLIFFSFNNNDNKAVITSEAMLKLKDSVKQKEVKHKTLFGIIIDSLKVEERKIRWNQNLADILSSYNVEYSVIHKLSEKSKDIFDVRKMKAGNDYTVIYAEDTIGKSAHHLIYEENPKNYVVFSFSDSIVVRKANKESSFRTSTFAGIINSSMYKTLTDVGESPLLVNELVDVFAWQVDFFRIKKGDRFKIIYEEEWVDDEKIGISKIIGAYFEHWDDKFYAIYYDQGNGVNYFDENGNSLRKEFLKTPLHYTRISSGYSLRRFHPILKRYRAHVGTDYAAPPGTPIRSVGDGIVTEATYSKYFGNYVKIKHNANYSTQYLHMSKIKYGVKNGAKVKQGQVIGFVGSTGYATGPHLCYRFWKNGKPVDARKIEFPPSEPIQEKYREIYNSKMNKVTEILDKIQFNSKKNILASINL